MKLTTIIKNITPSVAVMVVGLLGAWLVYDNYFSDKVSAEQVSTFEPAAGETTAAPAAEATAAVTEAAPAVEGTVDAAAAAVEEVKCMMDAEGKTVMNADNTACVPMPAEAAPAVEGVVDAAGAAAAPAVEAVPAVPAAPVVPAVPAAAH